MYVSSLITYDIRHAELQGRCFARVDLEPYGERFNTSIMGIVACKISTQTLRVCGAGVSRAKVKDEMNLKTSVAQRKEQGLRNDNLNDTAHMASKEMERQKKSA
jgi:hypothetical protein